MGTVKRLTSEKYLTIHLVSKLYPVSSIFGNWTKFSFHPLLFCATFNHLYNFSRLRDNCTFEISRVGEVWMNQADTAPAHQDLQAHRDLQVIRKNNSSDHHLTTYFRPQGEKGTHANNSERWTKGADRRGETIEETVCAAKPRYGLLFGKTKPQEWAWYVLLGPILCSQSNSEKVFNLHLWQSLLWNILKEWECCLW